jgi:hypothetical protein
MTSDDVDRLYELGLLTMGEMDQLLGKIGSEE